MVLVIDFGGQYSQLIARRVRECGVYCEIVPYSVDFKEIEQKNLQGIIFSGGPNSVFAEDAPSIDKNVFDLGVPILGICYGAQLICKQFGGEIESRDTCEYGKTEINVLTDSPLFSDIRNHDVCWMSHTDYMHLSSDGFIVTANTKDCPVAAFENSDRSLYGVQFHPEVEHTTFGTQLIKNFLYKVCRLSNTWKMSSFKDFKIKQIKEKIGDRKAICALSGGVDSSVAAVLVHRAIGRNLTCIFVDTGLLRKNEAQSVSDVFKKEFDMNFIKVDAKDRFLKKLAGVSDPETKRKIIGEEFIRIFEDESKKCGDVEFLVQGTIYPDVVESGFSGGKSSTIKSHHNVGGLPKNMKLSLVEPLRELFKDEVRQLGLDLGIPKHIISRQPFPGPGLAVRILGEVTEEKLKIVREADAIFTEEISKNESCSDIWQYFACLPGIKSVGVMGDRRTYQNVIALRAVCSSDAMTSQWARIPFDVLDVVSRRIVNEVPNVNRVVYDITSKPPSTIEWE